VCEEYKESYADGKHISAGVGAEYHDSYIKGVIRGLEIYGIDVNIINEEWVCPYCQKNKGMISD
jgi:hypothetical protein